MDELQNFAAMDGTNLTTILVILLVVVVCTSLLSQWIYVQIAKKSIRNKGNQQFLNVNYKINMNQQDIRVGFLRSVTPKNATLIARESAIHKGTLLELDFPSLDSDRRATSVNGKVIKSRSLGGAPESWLINVEFLEKNELAVEIIRNYLDSNKRVIE